MFRLLIMIAALALAVWIGLNVEQSPGLMVLTFAGWRVDIPLWLAVILMAVVLMVIHYVGLLLAGIIHTPGYLKKWSKHFRINRSKQFTHKGFIAFVEGNFSKAEKWLAKGAPGSDNPWLGYLFAAKAAQLQGESKRRDHYIHLAQVDEIKEHTEMAIGLTQAELALEKGQYDESINALLALNAKVPNHPQVLRLLQQNYVQSKQWQALSTLMPKLKQAGILNKAEMASLERSMIRNQFVSPTDFSYEDLIIQWQKIPHHMQVDSEIALEYAKALMKVASPIEAEEVLRESLKAQWNEQVIELYGHIQYPDPHKLLTKAEHWLKSHPQSPGLLFALGLICENQQLWGKAQRYYEASLSLAQRPQTYARLGTLLEKMDKPEQGALIFKKGLLLATSWQQ